MDQRALYLRVGALAVALVGATYVACTVTYGTEAGGALPDAGDAAPATPDVVIVDAGTPDVDAGEPLYRVPPRPSAEDETGQDDIKLLFAMDWVSLGPRPQDTTLTEDDMAFDLDGVATCPGQPSCTAPVASAAELACDGKGGRDNGMFRMLKRLGAATDLFNANSGGPSFLVSIEGYNGGLNDRQVTVRLFTSPGTQAALDAGGVDPDGGQVRPKLDGSDYWRIDQKQLQNTPPVGTPCTQASDPCTTSVKDTTAYVANGQLVSVFDIPLSFPEYGPKVQLDLRNGYLTARVQRADGGAWRLEDGQIVGRVPIESIVRLFAVFNDIFSSGKRYCEVPGDYATVRKLVCDARDIPADRNKDGKPEVCTGLSIDFMFHAKPALLGTVTSVPPAPEPCPEGIVYSCD
jgi:hypothetical protein